MCASNSLVKVIELKPTPPGNNLLKKEELGNIENVYPLDLYLCEKCGHLQLGHIVDPAILYKNDYSYVSATSSHFVSHLKNYASEMIKRFNIEPSTLVADIGSNDGTCLSFFKAKGMRVIGVDPASKIADRATELGIETIANFFSYDLAKTLRKERGPAGFITSHNACAHIDDLDDVVRGVEHWLDDDGLFVIEVGYLYDVYTNTWFDTIYHEHLDYHTVAPLKKFFDRFEMEIISVQRVSPQGGSIRVIVQKKRGKLKEDKTVEALIQMERDTGLFEKSTFYSFNERINDVRDNLSLLLKKLKKEGKKIAGYGAPTKATTLMQHFNLSSEILDFIVDDNPLKQDHYTPITHIPITSSDSLYARKPDYVLILAWNFSDQIIEMHRRYSNEIGHFIVPMPFPKVVNC